MNPEDETQPINEETREKYGVRGFPAILFISSDGGVITNHPGYLPPEKFVPVMEEALKKETKFQKTLAQYKKTPDDMKLSREIAILYLKRQQEDKAVPISKKMPNDVELNREFGIYYLGKNEIEKALLISEKMPDDVKLNHEFAITYLGLRQVENALAYSEKVFEKDPDNKSGLLPNLHLRIGVAYGQQIQNSSEDDTAKLTKMAVHHFQTIIDTYQKSDVYDMAQLYLGVTYSLAGEYKKSISTLEMLINHTTDEQMKKAAEARLKQVKELALEAPDNSDN